MSSYFLKCEENTKSISPLVSKATNIGTTILSKCAVCGDKKSKLKNKKQMDY